MLRAVSVLLFNIWERLDELVILWLSHLKVGLEVSWLDDAADMTLKLNLHLGPHTKPA